MNETDALELLRLSVWVAVYMAAPLVLPTMAVGIVIAFVQALTQVQESTLTFVPKMVVVFFCALAFAGFMASQLNTFSGELYARVQNGFE